MLCSPSNQIRDGETEKPRDTKEFYVPVQDKVLVHAKYRLYNTLCRASAIMSARPINNWQWCEKDSNPSSCNKYLTE